ncbi:TetR/AcrR family transcriptional regulator [Serratia marcescens]|jgi:Transcriptional regulator|nr:TetR/AcrR family transcriptional regulator [Serratia marcescens]
MDMSKRAARSADTQEKLRRAAINVFASKGFHETKVSDIVAEAQVSQPAFYLYYASKEAAFDSLVDEFRTALREATRLCLISPGLTPDELYKDLCLSFTRFLTVLTQDQALTQIGFFQPRSGDATKLEMTGWITENMERERSAGILRTDIPVQYQAGLVIGLLDQMTRMAEEEDNTEDLAKICARIFCDALAVVKVK